LIHNFERRLNLLALFLSSLAFQIVRDFGKLCGFLFYISSSQNETSLRLSAASQCMNVKCSAQPAKACSEFTRRGEW